MRMRCSLAAAIVGSLAWLAAGHAQAAKSTLDITLTAPAGSTIKVAVAVATVRMGDLWLDGDREPAVSPTRLKLTTALWPTLPVVRVGVDKPPTLAQVLATIESAPAGADALRRLAAAGRQCYTCAVVAVDLAHRPLRSLKVRVPVILTLPIVRATVTYVILTPSGHIAPGTISATAPSAPVGAVSAPRILSPTPGTRVGPRVDVIGLAPPGSLVIVWTEVYRRDTGERLASVPGLRTRADEQGRFSARVATPRIFIGEEVPLRYAVCAQAVIDGTKTAVTRVEVVSER